MAFGENFPQIDLASVVWEQIGDDDDPKNRLLTSIKIGPLFMHLEAVEVERTGEDGYLSAKYEGRDDYLQTLMNLEETTFSTLEIDGRAYVLWAVPFGD